MWPGQLSTVYSLPDPKPAAGTHLGSQIHYWEWSHSQTPSCCSRITLCPLQDNHPLASLPLLGYSLTIPSEAENIHKDYVFKLHFKSHVYYFRAESEYTFER